MLQIIDLSTSAERLAAADNDLDKAKLTTQVAVDAAQLSDRQKPFQQWLTSFDDVSQDIAENGPAGGWAKALQEFDAQQENRRKISEFPKNNEDLQEFIAANEAKIRDNSKSMKQKMAEAVTKLVDALHSRASIDGELAMRICGTILCITLPLFMIFAYNIFEDGPLNLATFVGLQASVVVMFLKTTPIKEFELEILESAFGYHLSRYRSNYDDDFDKSKEARLCCERYGGCCVDAHDHDDFHSEGYTKWRAMALYKMMKARKAEP